MSISIMNKSGLMLVHVQSGGGKCRNSFKTVCTGG